MKILNLDSLSKDSGRKLVLGGKEYKVRAMSVENFIETTRMVEQISKNKGTVADQIEGTIAMIVRCVPDVDVSLLKQIDLDNLHDVAAFVRGDDINEAETTEAVDAATADEKK